MNILHALICEVFCFWYNKGNVGDYFLEVDIAAEVMDMDIRKYEVFLAVVDRGSFISAANDLGYTQSGITHMMNSMEKECGFPLLMRSNKGVVLTLEGERVLPEIRRIVAINKHLEEYFHEIRGIKTGKVRIGCFPTIACALMPKIFKVFRQQYPEINLDIVEENSVKTLERWLSSGFLDVGFFSKQPQQAYEWIPIMEDEYLAVLPEDHPLAACPAVTPEQLMQENFFMFRSIDGIDKDVSRYFDAQGISIVSTFTSNSDYAVMYMINEGLGTGMQPKLILDLCAKTHENIVTRPMNPPARRELGLAVQSVKGSPLAVKRFISCVKTTFSIP